MNDGERLWRAILHRPHSGHLRQVYADWLEEHGDPRSEFIRLQGRMAPDDPHREGELLRAHESEWLGPVAEHARDWEFAGGLLDWVSVEAAVFLAHAEDWVRRPGLLGVHLRRLKGHVAGLAACPALARLPFLFLGDNELTDDDVRTLLASRYLGGVRALYLQSNRIGREGFEALAAAPALARLRELSVANNHLSLGDLPEVPAGAPLARVRFLDFAQLFDTGTAAGRILASPGLPRLRSLYLAGTLDDPGTLPELAASPAFRRLRRFRTSLGEDSQDDLARFAASPHVAGLTELSLDFMTTGPDHGVEALAASEHLIELRKLTLRSAVSDPRTLVTLGQSRAFPRLRSLAVVRNIWSQSVDGPGELEAFLGSSVVRRLHALTFEGWPLEDGAVRSLTWQGPLPLRRLYLSTVLAAPAAWEPARRSLPHLERLELRDAPPGVLAALGGRPGLRSVALDRFGPDDAAALAGLPGLTRLRLMAVPDGDAAVVFDRMMACPHAGRWRSLFLNWAFGSLPAGFDGSPLTALEELSHEGLTAEAIGRLAGWPGLAGLRRLRVGHSRPGALAALAASPHLGPRLRLVVDDAGGNLVGQRSADDVGPLRGRLGGRAAFNWRAVPRGVIFGGRWHDDT